MPKLVAVCVSLVILSYIHLSNASVIKLAEFKHPPETSTFQEEIHESSHVEKKDIKGDSTNFRTTRDYYDVDETLGESEQPAKRIDGTLHPTRGRNLNC